MNLINLWIVLGLLFIGFPVSMLFRRLLELVPGDSDLGFWFNWLLGFLYSTAFIVPFFILIALTFFFINIFDNYFIRALLCIAIPVISYSSRQILCTMGEGYIYTPLCTLNFALSYLSSPLPFLGIYYLVLGSRRKRRT